MLLYHVGLDIIENVDLKRGRVNADFGQGFYLSDDLEFSKKWARVTEKFDIIVNTYELDINNLNVLNFNDKNEKWFDYIYKNRNDYDDIYNNYDVIIGPIANDIIFDLYGITTSGLIDKNTALKILMEGPKYNQIVIKSEKAKSQLKFIKSEILNKDLIKEYKKEIRKEEELYQEKVFSMLDDNIKDLLS